jgi:hypothetical protein
MGGCSGDEERLIIFSEGVNLMHTACRLRAVATIGGWICNFPDADQET